MPGNVTVTEAAGQPTIPASADFAMCVVGYTTATPIAANTVSPPYSSPGSLAAAWGLGDAVDAALQAVVQTPGNPAPPPVCILRTPATTPGVRGTLDTSDVTGSAVITQTATTPVGTYEPVCRVLDDGNDGAGGIIGSAGIVLQASPDNGRTWLAAEQLGTATTFKMRIPVNGTLTDTGVQWTIGPATTNAAYVALAVELRADTLAHLANATAHDGADTSAAQVALAASSVPATVTASTAVVNLVLAAMVSHVVNITSVHDGPDLPGYTALALLTAATTTIEGIDLAIALKDIINDHEAHTFGNTAAGLQAATATSVAPVTYTAAADFLAGGVAALDANPRRLVFRTANGTGSASDAPATCDVTGFDYAGNAQSETGVVISQVNGGGVTTTKAFKGTGLSVAFAAADGTGATIQIGYSNGVHNSADVTNTITADDPTYGTLVTDDQWSETISTPPRWAVADLYTAGSPPTGAFRALAQSSTAFALIAITEPVVAGDFATLSAALNYLASREGGSKHVALIVRFRDPSSGETDAQYITAFRVFAQANQDDRICCVAGNGWLTDAFRAFVYHRSGMPAVLARLQSMQAIPGRIGERMAQHPGYVARGPLENFTLVDDDGNPIDQAHDEALVGGIDGPINSIGGGLTFYYQRLSTIAGTYVSQAPVMHPSTSDTLTLMDRRVLNGIKTVAQTIAWLEIQGANIFDAETLALDDDIRNAIQAKISKAIRDRYPREFQNPDDPNLVSIDPTVSVDGSRVTIAGTVNVRLFGYTDVIALTFDASR